MSIGFTYVEFVELLASSVIGGFLTGGLLVYVYIRYERRNHERCGRELGESQAELGMNNPNGPGSDSLRESHFLPIQNPPSDEIITSLATYGSNSSIRSSLDAEDSCHHDDDRIVYGVRNLPSASPILLPSTNVKLFVVQDASFSAIQSHYARYSRSSDTVRMGFGNGTVDKVKGTRVGGGGC